MKRRWNGTAKIFVTPVTATADSLMLNFEASKSGSGSQRVFGLLLYMSAQFALRDCVDEFPNLAFVAADLQIDAPVRQIADRAGDVETFGDLLYGISKANALVLRPFIGAFWIGLIFGPAMLRPVVYALFWL